MARTPVVCPAPVGRDAPLATLRELQRRAAAGEGEVVLLGGDAGVGKSRLVRELKLEAAAMHARVVEGRCSSAESSVPYAPFMDALRFRLARGEGEVVARILGPLNELLAPIFPELERGASADRSTELVADRPFELIVRALERLARSDPMLLVLEDVHWADPTSLELIQLIARRATSLRLLVVATFRSDELHAAHPLRRLVAAMARERVGVELRLAPLDRAGTEEMLRRLLDREPDAALAASVWRRTEGNPFFIEELVSALTDAERGGAAPIALERIALPDTVSEAVLARVQSLGSLAAEILSAASVIGRRFDFELLRDVTRLSEEELLAIVERLVSHQLLREERARGEECYVFPHALTQEALYGSVISRRRRLLHRRVAEALERRPVPRPLDELAYHFRLGGDRERAHEYASLAGDEAARLRAWDDAAAHYENALASLEGAETDGTREAALLERLADVAWRQSRSLQARQYAEDALRLRRARGDALGSARLLRRLAADAAERDEHDMAASRLDDAMALLRDHPPSAELARVVDDLGRLALARGDFERAEELLLHGLTLATQDADHVEEVLALVSLGELGVRESDVTAGVARLDLALELLREGWLPVERAASVYAAGVRTLVLAHEYARALEWTAAGRELFREQGVAGLDALFRAHESAIRTITGTANDSVGTMREAVADLRSTERPELREGLRMLGFVLRVRGDLFGARAAYEEARALGEGESALGLALVALAEGRAGEAIHALEQALAAIPRGNALLRRRILPYAIEAMLAAGHLSRAREIVEGERASDDPRAGAIELRYARGIVRAAEGRAEEAEAELIAADEGWTSLGNRLEAARSRVALAELRSARTDPAGGVALARQLLDALLPLGLAPEIERVRRILRRAGVRTRPLVRRASAPAPGSETARLTTREEMVLREVAHGRTNREIAAALGIAEKTVSVHVSHILAKLGCRTRTQAARHATMTRSPAAV